MVEEEEEEEPVDREPSQAVVSDSIVSSESVGESNSLSFPNEGDIREESELIHIHQSSSVDGAPCPFEELGESDDVTLQIHSDNNNREFELNIQGSGHLHDIIDKLFHGLQSKVVSEEGRGEGESLIPPTNHST